MITSQDKSRYPLHLVVEVPAPRRRCRHPLLTLSRLPPRHCIPPPQPSPPSPPPRHHIYCHLHKRYLLEIFIQIQMM